MADNYELRDRDTEIPLKEAELWVKKWRDTNEGTDVKKKVCSYLIPKVNLEKVLAQNIDAARAYIGINNAGEQTLMIVGTRLDQETGVYVDMLPGYAKSEGDSDPDPGIYDFSSPSPPNQGDPSSPLNP